MVFSFFPWFFELMILLSILLFFLFICSSHRLVLYFPSVKIMMLNRFYFNRLFLYFSIISFHGQSVFSRSKRESINFLEWNFYLNDKNYLIFSKALDIVWPHSFSFCYIFLSLSSLFFHFIHAVLYNDYKKLPTECEYCMRRLQFILTY